jgi:hypothetical protein
MRRSLALLALVLLALFPTPAAAQAEEPAMFINRTRLVRIATGTREDVRLINNPTVLWTSGVGVVVETVADAMPLVPEATRPDPSLWWQYAVEHEVRAHLLPDVIGVIPYEAGAATRTLVVNVDVWRTQAERTGGAPPLVQNTFIFVYNRKPRDFGAHVEEVVEAWLQRATLSGWTGDRRDPAVMAQASTEAAADPEGILDNQRLQNADGTPYSLLAWRRAG